MRFLGGYTNTGFHSSSMKVPEGLSVSRFIDLNVVNKPSFVRVYTESLAVYINLHLWVWDNLTRIYNAVAIGHHHSDGGEVRAFYCAPRILNYESGVDVSSRARQVICA